MCKEPEPMREIHQIQERLFEEEKDLSSVERIRKLHKEATEIMKEYGLRIGSVSKTCSSTNGSS